MHVERYLERLGLDGAGPPTLEQLTTLHVRHLEVVPFENLDIHNRVPIVLDEERILRKIVERRRGGFCYELNTAFGWLLSRLGYQVTRLAAEVARKEGGFGIPYDHMTLRVELDRGPYLADVGFGDSFRRPLPLEAANEVTELGHVYRLARRRSWWILERRVRESSAFVAQYRFTLEAHQLADFRPGCRYHQTSPESTFTRAPLCTRVRGEGRVTLLPERMVRTWKGGRSETPVHGRDEWLRVLKSEFGIELEETGRDAVGKTRP